MKSNSSCFCCGKSNESGLKLDYIYPEKGIARVELRIPVFFTGWKEYTHGGFISMILDETMAHACLSSGLHAVTAELRIRYISPVKVNTPVIVTGSIAGQRNKIINIKAKMVSLSGVCIARGKAKFFII